MQAFFSQELYNFVMVWWHQALSSFPVLALIILAAIIIDAFMGGPTYLGRIPGWDSFLRMVIEGLDRRFNLKSFHAVAGISYGLLLLLLGIGASAGLGWWLDQQPDILWIVILKLALLTLLLGQRTVIDTARMLATDLEQTTSASPEGKYAAVRWMVERLTHRLIDGFVINILILISFGFSGLLAYRFASVLMSVGYPNGCRIRSAPFYMPLLLIAWPFSFLFGVISWAFIMLAALVVLPHRIHHGFYVFAEKGWYKCLPQRFITYSLIAHLLNINLKADPSGPDKGSFWLGKDNAQARVMPSQLIQAMALHIVSWLQITGLLALCFLILTDTPQ